MRGNAFTRSDRRPPPGDALLVIDVQAGFSTWGEAPLYDTENFLRTIRFLQVRARVAGAPVVFVRHEGLRGHPAESRTPGWEIDERVAPVDGEVVVPKTSTDSFHQTRLHDELQERGVRHLVVVGCVTEFCVDTTVRRACTLGYDVTLASDGHTTFDATTDALPPAPVRIRLFNDILSRLAHPDSATTVRAAEEITFA